MIHRAGGVGHRRQAGTLSGRRPREPDDPRQLGWLLAALAMEARARQVVERLAKIRRMVI